jgi:TPR repeat protein
MILDQQKNKKTSQKSTHEGIIDLFLQYVKTLETSKIPDFVNNHRESFYKLHISLAKIVCLLTEVLLLASRGDIVISLLVKTHSNIRNNLSRVFDSVKKITSNNIEHHELIAISELQCALALRITSTTQTPFEREALLHCKNSISVCSDFFPALFLAGILSYEAGDLQTAQQYFTKCVTEKKRYLYQSLNLLGCVYIELRDYVQGLDFFQRAIKAQNNEAGKEGTIESLIPIYNTVIVYGKQKNYFAQHKMLEYMLTLVQKQPRKRSIWNDIMIPSAYNNVPTPIQVMYMMAQCSVKQQMYDFAVPAYRYIIDAIVNDKNTDKCWGILHGVKPITIFQEYIFSLLESNDSESALPVCEHVLKYYPDDITTLMYKSDALLSMEKPHSNAAFEALDHIILLLERKEGNERLSNFDLSTLAQAYNNKAQLLICMDEKCNALIALRKAYTLLEHSDADAMLCVSFNLTLLYLQLNQIENAAAIWFKQRHVSIAENREYYLGLYHRLNNEKKERKEQSVLVSHVTGTCSLEQQKLLDIEVFYLFSKHLEEKNEKIQGGEIIEHLTT